jgi:8-oxo-dGTP pyrophosphatase MutT (NUDIX family)
VGAIFGIAERSSDRFFISQLYAHGGVLHGVYRKRHLGDGEDSFMPGEEGGVFRLGAAAFGIAICAEAGVDFPWMQARQAGASLVFFCSAPGLYGRRTDEAGWRAGLSWWEECGLGDAVRRARAHGLWVAMTGQSGSNVDEDFPGLAALVDPQGAIVSRLPDWQPGTLVVDIPIKVTMEPVREAVRTLIIDDTGRALLVRFQDDFNGLNWWCPPGGGLEPGEDHLDAAKRELAEETGRDDVLLGAFIGGRTHTFCFNGVWMTQRERWIACRAHAFTVPPDRVALLRAENIREIRWWDPSDLVASGVVTAPRQLASLIEETASGIEPDPGRDLGR